MRIFCLVNSAYHCDPRFSLNEEEDIDSLIYEDQFDVEEILDKR